MRICDPACGTGGFLLAAYEYVSARSHARMDPDQKRHPPGRGTTRLGDRPDNRPTVRYEPAPARHRPRERRPARSSATTRLAGDPGRAVSDGAHQSAVRQEVVITIVERGRDEREGRPHVHPRTTSGPPRATSSSTSSSTSRSLLKTRPRRGGRARTTCSSRAAPARRSGASCCTSATSTHCCACRPGSSTPGREGERALLRSQAGRARRRGPRSSGSTTCARTSTSRSNRIRCDSRTSTTSSPATSRTTARARVETERFDRFTYDELIARDKVSLDIIWLRDESLEDTDNLPHPR